MDSSNKTSNPVLEKSYKFALRIVKFQRAKTPLLIDNCKLIIEE